MYNDNNSCAFLSDILELTLHEVTKTLKLNY